MTKFSESVSFYKTFTPEALANSIAAAEVSARTLQSQLSAMRKAQRIQKTTTNGGKVPQHTREA